MGDAPQHGVLRGIPENCVRRCPTLPRSPERSTIGAGGLSFRVRNGTGRFPTAMTTDTRVDLCSLVFPHPSVGGAGGVLVGNRTVDAELCLLCCVLTPVVCGV